MGTFLRDEQLTNLCLDAEALTAIAKVLASHQVAMPEYVANPSMTEPTTFLTYTIRFDEKGYRIFDLSQLLDHFGSASKVERVVFELVSATALSTNRISGSFVDLRLDTNPQLPCFLTASSDNEGWVNSTFSAVSETLRSYRTRNGWIRNAWVELLLQFGGILMGFAVSVWGASKISPQLKIENAFLISFVLVLLLFSNIWAPIRSMFLQGLGVVFPVIRFYRPHKDRLYWLCEAVVGGIVVALTLFVLNWAFMYVGHILGQFLGPRL